MAAYAIQVQNNFGYGAPELKKNYTKFLSHGFIIAAVLHFLAIGIYWNASRERKRVIVDPTILGPPPPIIERATSGVKVSDAKPRFGIPVAVPDFHTVGDEFPTQQELNLSGPIVGDERGEGEFPQPKSLNHLTLSLEWRKIPLSLNRYGLPIRKLLDAQT